MKFLVYGLVALSLLVMGTPAMAKVEVTGDAYLNYSSMYLWRGFNLSDSNPVLQGGMDLSFSGLTISYWSNYQIDGTEMDETDLTVDYSYKASDLVTLNVGNILYSITGPDTSEVYAGVSLDTFLSPSLTVYYDYDLFDGDVYVAGSIGHSFDLQDNLTVNLGALVSYVDNDSYSDLHNAELSAGLDYKVNDQITLSPAVVFSTPLSDKADDVIDQEFMGGLTLNLSF